MEGEGGQLKRKLVFKCFVHEPFTECLFFLLYKCIWLIVSLTQTSM